MHQVVNTSSDKHGGTLGFDNIIQVSHLPATLQELRTPFKVELFYKLLRMCVAPLKQWVSEPARSGDGTVFLFIFNGKSCQRSLTADTNKGYTASSRLLPCFTIPHMLLVAILMLKTYIDPSKFTLKAIIWC